MVNLEVSHIARSITRRIREVAAPRTDHPALSDELERLTGAQSRRQRTTAPAPQDTSPARRAHARAPRGENKMKILAALTGAPRTVANDRK
jgi:hypothetical protein